MSKITVGLDVGDRFSQVCAIDAEGVVVQESRVATTREALRERLPGQPSCRVILETGPHAGWISRELSAVGHEVLVANGRKLRWLYANEHKTDRVDAQYLARVGRWDPTLLSPIRGAVRVPMERCDCCELARAWSARVRA